jgi:hypothetical protein
MLGTSLRRAQPKKNKVTVKSLSSQSGRGWPARRPAAAIIALARATPHANQFPSYVLIALGVAQSNGTAAAGLSAIAVLASSTRPDRLW